MQKLVYYCQGESHKATNKPCQDYAQCYMDESMSVAIVSDGHGGSRYFRSDVGSKTAVEATLECVKEFVGNVDARIFEDRPFTQVSTLAEEIKTHNMRKRTDVDDAIRRLTTSIVYKWRMRIEDHFNNTPLTASEQALFEKDHRIDRTYGCTLMCYVRTKKYWFAFHLGDGKCFSFSGDGNWCEPIPWDEKCFLNKTTSICDSEAFDEFRYCYQGNKEFPVAVFLASDGLDDSFGEATNQANFYAEILKLLAESGVEKAQNEIEETLPVLSKRRSQDDMSVACIFDEEVLASIIPNVIRWQRNNVKTSIDATNAKIQELRNKLAQYDNKHLYHQRDLIECQYAQTELERAFEAKKRYVVSYNKYSKQIIDEEFAEYTDDIGIYEHEEEAKRQELTQERIRKRLRLEKHPFYKWD